MALSARKLDRRIKFLRSAMVENRLGEEVPGEPVEVAGAWAKYTAVSDGEKFRAGKSEVSYSARFVVRWSADIASVLHTDLIQFDGVDYEIKGIKEIERRRWVEFTAGGANGN